MQRLQAAEVQGVINTHYGILFDYNLINVNLNSSIGANIKNKMMYLATVLQAHGKYTMPNTVLKGFVSDTKKHAYK